MDEAIVRIQTMLNELYASPTGIRFLHADLLPGNIVRTGEEIAVLDFDDSLWGHPVQDVGITLWWFQRFPHADALSDAYLHGYSSHTSWPAA